MVLYESYREYGVICVAWRVWCYLRGTGSVMLCERYMKYCVNERHRECVVICVAWGIYCFLRGIRSVVLYEWHFECRVYESGGVI